MFRWLGKKVKDHSISKMRSDIEEFLSLLKGMQDDEMGMVVAYASVTRVTLANEGMLPSRILEFETCQTTPEAPESAMKLVSFANFPKRKGNYR